MGSDVVVAAARSSFFANPIAANDASGLAAAEFPDDTVVACELAAAVAVLPKLQWVSRDRTMIADVTSSSVG